MTQKDKKEIRILAVDDESMVLEAYKEALSLPIQGLSSDYRFEVLGCENGDQAIENVKNALEDDNPFAVGFLDVNLPSGLDGIQTGEMIRKIDPSINFVIVTGMPNINSQEIAFRIQPEDKILFIQKPFHLQEIRQFATALSAKWQSEKALQKANRELKTKIMELEQNQKELLANRDELESVNSQLMETNNALSVLARNLDRTKKESEKRILQRTRTLILPIIERLQQSNRLERYRSEFDLLINHVENLTFGIGTNMEISETLSATETRIAAMIANGMSSIEIANHLYISPATVKTHRKNIRKKLKLRNSNINLRTYLESYIRREQSLTLDNLI